VAVAFEGWSSTLATPAAGLALVTWIGAASWYLMIGFLFPRLLLLLPDGRLPSPRWRPVDLLQGVVLAALGILIAAEALMLLEPVPVHAQPFLGFAAVVEQYGYVLVLLLMLVAAMSMVVRLRQSTGVERLQLKWIGWVVLILVVALLVSGVLELVSPAASEAVGSLAFAAIGMLPVAIGVAVLRYRLYDIDRLISRSIGWAVASGIVVAAFVGAVVSLQAALAGFTEGQTLAVAGSTLIAFALFQPVRRRVQLSVDRRFDRARYDGERVAGAFAERLRDQVDLLGLETDMHATVVGALRPRSLEVWVRNVGVEGPR
jgi:hypothetical protein